MGNFFFRGCGGGVAEAEGAVRGGTRGGRSTGPSTFVIPQRSEGIRTVSWGALRGRLA